MSYVTVEYYKNEYKGSIEDDSIEIMLSKASDVVDQLTYGRIQGRGGIDRLTEFQQGQVKKAVCLQADFMENSVSLPEGVSSYSINGVSVSMGEGGGGNYSGSAMRCLLLSGLRYGGL